MPTETGAQICLAIPRFSSGVGVLHQRMHDRRSPAGRHTLRRRFFQPVTEAVPQRVTLNLGIDRRRCFLEGCGVMLSSRHLWASHPRARGKESGRPGEVRRRRVITPLLRPAIHGSNLKCHASHTLSFSHHAEVAALEPAEQERWPPARRRRLRVR